MDVIKSIVDLNSLSTASRHSSYQEWFQIRPELLNKIRHLFSALCMFKHPWLIIKTGIYSEEDLFEEIWYTSNYNTKNIVVAKIHNHDHGR